MLFYSFEFLYLFYPLVCVVFFLLGKIWPNSPRAGIVWLTLSSLFFYAWWDYNYVILIAFSIIFNYFAGLRLRQFKSRALLIFAISLNLTLIGYYKYAGFLTEIVNALSGSGLDVGKIILPLAISFFTFQQIAWLVDNYLGLIKSRERSFFQYALFVLFFPQLIAGPIVHHSEMMPQFGETKQRRFSWDNFSAGLSIFVLGLGKKVIIADNVAPIANSVFDGVTDATKIGFLDAWGGALAYTSQLYFDFSGYADMAIGLALILNIRLPINFNSPYQATSISEFWRRWHMTLSRFLRDYLYIPFGGNRKGRYRRYLNLMLTMLLGGLWHGANWTFVFWGGLHGLYLVINQMWSKLSPWRLPGFVSWFLTFISVVLAWVFFRSENFDTALAIISAMVRPESLRSSPDHAISINIFGMTILAVSLLVAFILPNTQQLMRNKIESIEIYQAMSKLKYKLLGFRFSTPAIDWSISWLVILGVISTISIWMLLDSTTINEFIYFQF